MKFKYQAKTQEGEMQVGFVEAGNRDSALNILTGHNLFVMSIAEADQPSPVDRINAFLNRVKRKDMVIFARQLATLLEARLPLNNALKILREQTTNKMLQ